MKYTLKELLSKFKFVTESSGVDYKEDFAKNTLDAIKDRMTGEEIFNALGTLLNKSQRPTVQKLLHYSKGGFEPYELALARASAGISDESVSYVTNSAIDAGMLATEGLLDQGGDKYLGKQAFEIAYNNKIEELRAGGITVPIWRVSAGSDKEAKTVVVAQAVKDGLISIGLAKSHCPGITLENLDTPQIAYTAGFQIQKSKASEMVAEAFAPKMISRDPSEAFSEEGEEPRQEPTHPKPGMFSEKEMHDIRMAELRASVENNRPACLKKKERPAYIDSDLIDPASTSALFHNLESNY